MTLPIGSGTLYVQQTPPGLQAAIDRVAISSDGTTLFAGYNNDTGLGVALKGTVSGTTLTEISIPDSVSTTLTNVGFAPDGTAYLTGVSNYLPAIYKLAHTSNEAVQITIPGTDQGDLSDLAVAPDGTAVFVGNDSTNSLPLLLRLAPGGAAVSSIFPSAPVGLLNSIAVRSDGLMLMGGHDYNANISLVYTLSPPYTTPVQIAVSDTEGTINSIAFAPDGTAILVGEKSGGGLIYRFVDGVLEPIEYVGASNEYFSSVAIGPDGTAIMVGGSAYGYFSPPIASRLPPGATEAIPIGVPDVSGELVSVAIGSENIAVLSGYNGEFNQALIYTVPTSGAPLSVVANSHIYEQSVSWSLAIYTYPVLYDTNRLNPFYNLQLSNTAGKLNQAGLP